MSRRLGAFSSFASSVGRCNERSTATARAKVVVAAADATIKVTMDDFGELAEHVWLRVIHQPFMVMRDQPDIACPIVATAKFDEILEVLPVEGQKWACLSPRELEKRQLAEECRDGAWVLIDGTSLGLGMLLEPRLPRWFRVVLRPHIVLRSAPGKQFVEVGRIRTGAVFEVMATNNGWVQLAGAHQFCSVAEEVGEDEAWAQVDASEDGLGVLLIPCWSTDGLSIFDAYDEPHGGQQIPARISLRPKANTFPDNAKEYVEGPAQCREPLCFITRKSGWSTEKPNMRFQQVWSDPSAGLVRHEFQMCLQDCGSLDLKLQRSSEILSANDRGMPGLLVTDSMDEPQDVADSLEKRYAPDGKLYVKSEFIDEWGPELGLEEWSRAGREAAFEPLTFTEADSIVPLEYGMISFQIVSMLKGLKWRLYPAVAEEEPLCSRWGAHNILVPGVHDAIQTTLGATEGHGRDFCIVEPFGTAITICVEISHETGAYDPSSEQEVCGSTKFNVWYEHSAKEVSFSGCDPTVPDKRLVRLALRQRGVHGLPVKYS